jgi:hypothetical protein
MSDGSVKGWGATKFALAPRIGEVVVRSVGEVAHVFEVLMVMHPPEPVKVGRDGVEYSGGDLWLINRGPEHEWISKNVKSKR